MNFDTRKAQFFIITVVIVAGSLSITVDVLEDYTSINYNEVLSSRGPAQFESLERSIDSVWYHEDWQYRREVSVFERSGRTVTDHPVNITVNTEQLIDEGKMQGDCDDLRMAEDGEAIPMQIEEGECNSTSTTVWFLTSVDENARENDVYLYYGNSNVTAPEYETRLTWNEQDDGDIVVENEFLRLVTGESGGEEGFVEVRRKSQRDLVEDGRMLFQGSGFEIREDGPVYIRLEAGGRNFTVFHSNRFVRFDGPHTLGPARWFASGSTILTHWLAGNGGEEEIDGSSFGGTFGGGDLPYVAAYNQDMAESIAMFVPLRDFSGTVSGFTAHENGSGLYMGLDGSGSAPYLDYWLGQGVPRPTADIHSNPPRAVLGSEEAIGWFTPSTGWENRIKLSVEENNGTFLTNYPANVSLNLGQLNVREDCSDLTFVERGVVRPRKVWDQCDSRSFDEPTRFLARFPFDEGRGVFVNDTTGTFSGELEEAGGDLDDMWIPGRYGFALSFVDDQHLDIDNNPPIQLRGFPFTISMWVRMDVDEQDYPDNRIRLLYYPENAPAIAVANDSAGTFHLQGLFRNNTDDRNVVEGTTDLSTLDRGWHHVAYVYNQSASNLSMYLDGELDGFARTYGDLEVVPEEIRVAEDIDMDVDELKIYNDDLTADEIRDQYTEFTTVSFLTNLSATAVERDVEVYTESVSTLNESYEDATFQPPGDLTAEEKPSVNPSRRQTYLPLIRNLETRMRQSSLSSQVVMEVVDQCTFVRFNTGRFDLRKYVC